MVIDKKGTLNCDVKEQISLPHAYLLIKIINIDYDSKSITSISKLIYSMNMEHPYQISKSIILSINFLLPEDVP